MAPRLILYRANPACWHGQRPHVLGSLPLAFCSLRFALPLRYVCLKTFLYLDLRNHCKDFMDPVSLFGIAVGTTSLLKTLLEASLGLPSALRGIKTIDETTEEFAKELEAFRSILLLFENELRNSELVPDVGRWWDLSRLEELFSNVVKTFSRLEAIVKDVGKQRCVLSSLRQYWRSKSYDKEIGHLRLRTGTYITALQILIGLGKM